LNARPTQALVPEVTACIPTFRRPSELRATLETLLAATTIAGTVLVSEGTGEEDERRAVQDVLRSIDDRGVRLELLPPPRDGGRSGNRNWLAQHVGTELLLFVDDDVDVHSEFLSDAL
jgi:glycosyltransferase involved in cell wall biosynthesis